MNNIKKIFRPLFSIIDFQNLDIKNKQITFYSEGKSYWPHLEGLLKTTLKKNQMSVCYVSSSIDDPGLLFNHPKLKTFYIGDGYFRDYFFKVLNTKLMIMTMPDLNNFQIKRSNNNVHYVYVQHSLVSLHMVYRNGAFDNFDTICAAGPHHVNELKYIERKYKLPKKHILKHGYSRLDKLISCYNAKKNLKKNYNKLKKIILIAPSWGSNCLIESGLCKNIVKELINLGHQVILRPHPQTMRLNTSKVNEITKEYKNNDKFKLDESILDDHSLHISDIMISDWSGVALEYSLGLKKPIIYCDIPKKVNNYLYEDITLVPIEISIREKIGVIWNCKSPLSKIIKKCILRKLNETNKLLRLNTFNVAYSDNKFVEFLESFFIEEYK